MQIKIEKPRLGIPVSLIIDDGAPCINPLYYFRLQVERQNYDRHERLIPLDFMENFVHVCRTHNLRGKFTILPYPAGLGSILAGWDGCGPAQLAHWLELAQVGLSPDFDITPEILTHTLALDLRTHSLLPQPEHIWMENRSRAELAEYLGASVDILKKAGFTPTGITQPCYFKGNREDYSQAVLEAVQTAGGPPVTFYFIDGYFAGPPFPEPPVMWSDGERGKAVVSILDYTDDYCWSTIRPVRSQGVSWVADHYLTQDGASGRLAELAQNGAWVVFCSHWQSLYSDGSREGLAVLGEVADRLEHVYGARLLWMKNSEIARYRAAEESCLVIPLPGQDGIAIRLDSAFDCPDFTFTISSPEIPGTWIDKAYLTLPGNQSHLLDHDMGADGLLVSGAWRQAGDHLHVCIPLRRGSQELIFKRGTP